MPGKCISRPEHLTSQHAQHAESEKLTFAGDCQLLNLDTAANVQALARFEELVHKVNDMLTNRVESNLTLISRMLLINLPADQSFSYEEFGTMQARFIVRQGTAISVRNQEVRRSVQELLQLIRTTPRENPEVKMDRDAAANFNDHFYLRMYGAIAAAMRNSFAVLKERVAPARRGDGAAPAFFDVEVDLKVPDVVVSPSLDEIQEAVNTCAKKVLTVTKGLKPWAVDRNIGSFWDMLSHDLDIVKSVLLLKGTIDAAKETVRWQLRFTLQSSVHALGHDFLSGRHRHVHNQSTVCSAKRSLRTQDISSENVGALHLVQTREWPGLKCHCLAWLWCSSTRCLDAVRFRLCAGPSLH